MKPITSREIAQLRGQKAANLLRRLPPLPPPQFPVTAEIRRGMFGTDRIFIVGGGHSLTGFDFSLLKDEITIGINKAFAYFDPNIIFSMDRRFWQWVELANGENGFTEELRDKFINYQHGFKCWLTPYNELYTPDIIKLRCGTLDGWGENLEGGIGHGNNSGYAALNLAYVLGFRQIYLLGFDMAGVEGKQKWFHDGYPIQDSDKIYDKMMYFFNKSAAPALKKAGVEVLNCSPISRLTCFPKFDLTGFQYKKHPLVLCFHTPDELYQGRADALEASLKSKGYRRKFVKYPKVGGWLTNVKVKQKLLLAEMEKEEEESFILLDADAVVVGDLMSIIDDWSDLACHLREGKELLAGTLYIKNTEKMRQFVREWIEINEEFPGMWDQKVLQNLVNAWGSTLNFRNLPAQFCKIYDLMASVENPIVVHTQASRAYGDKSK